MSAPEMTSNKPYLIRGLYEWIVDNGMVPHIVAKVDVNHIQVPMKYAKDGTITLNISPHATLNLVINNEYITFSARFSGELMDIVVPIFAVLAIYAKETGAGMAFAEEDETQGSNTTPPTSEKSHLKRVK